MAYPYFKHRELRVKERFHKDQRIRFDSLIFGIASPEQIRHWAERILPNGSVIGEVSNGRTVDYKTLKPLRGGLFCQRTFGPIKDFVCACGNGPTIDEGSPTLWFCPTCEVEFQPATIRRHRMGYVKLRAGCVHLFYFKGRPNYLSILLAKKPIVLKEIIYSLRVLVTIHDLDLFPSDLRSMTAPVPDDQWYRPNQTIPFHGDFFTQADNQEFIFTYMSSFPESDDLPILDYCLGSAIPSSLEITPEMDDSTVSQMAFEVFLKELRAEDESRVMGILNRIGGQSLANIINQMDLPLLQKVLASDIQRINCVIKHLSKVYRTRKGDQKYRKLKRRRLSWIRRYKLINTFLSNQRNPAWMVLSILPILPPTLRPIIIMDNGATMASDINRLYQRVIYRNDRLLQMPIINTSTIGFTYRLLQESVESVFENGKGDSRPVMGTNNRQLAALVDRLKGKRGRFRFNLLGKRTDYSGRSVIVVGPKMSLHECGLPREIALQLFRPFLLRRLLAQDNVNSFKQAHDQIRYKNPIIWNILSSLLPHFPVLLNRAPTLHRLGIQAFQPRIVSSQAIALHPLVCTGFNADFDGDQMAVHMPLSFHARAEAWRLLWSRNNLLGPANGDPILTPSQDMILGSYYLTKIREKNSPEAPIAEATSSKNLIEGTSSKRKDLFKGPSSKDLFEGPLRRGDGFYFTDMADAIYAFDQDLVNIRTPIWLRLAAYQLNQTDEGPQSPIEVQVQSDGFGFVVFNDIQQHRHWPFAIKQNDFRTTYTWILSQYVQTTIGRVLVNQLIMGKDHPEPAAIMPWIQTRIDKMKDEFRGKRQDEVTQFQLKRFVKKKEYKLQRLELFLHENFDKCIESMQKPEIFGKSDDSRIMKNICWVLGDFETSAKILFSTKKKLSIEKLKSKIKASLARPRLMDLPWETRFRRTSSKVLKRIVERYEGFLKRRYYEKFLITPQDQKYLVTPQDRELASSEIYGPARFELLKRLPKGKRIKLDDEDRQVKPDKPIKPSSLTDGQG